MYQFKKKEPPLKDILMNNSCTFNYWLTVLIMGGLLSFITTNSTFAQSIQNNSVIGEYEEGQLYLKIKEGANHDIVFNAIQYGPKSPLSGLLNEFGISEIERAFKRLNPLKNIYKVRFDDVESTAALIRELNTFDWVEYAERVPKHRFFITPNDINTNQYSIALTECEAAWDLSLGSSNIIIGMVDDAVLLDHQDLAPIIWTNAGETPGNGVDDDGNGYVDDIQGWDAADGDNDPNPLNPTDTYFSHGTHCAGIAAAATDNGIGIASPGFGVQLMAIKIGNDADSGLNNAMGGVEYAIASGAHVISMSWGGGGESAAEQEVFDLAYEQGIVCIAAAGNDNTDNPMYPASYNHIINVGASDSGDIKADFSNYGTTIDIMAPGVQIWSSVAGSTDAYAYNDGTSMACPFVSGAAALMLSFDPTATPDRIEQCLKETADDIYPLNPTFTTDQLGAGRVNVFGAMQCVPSEPVANFITAADPPCAGELTQLIDTSAGTDINMWEWSMPGATPSTSTEENPNVSFPSDGVYDVTLTVTNDLGSSTITIPITVSPPTATIIGDEVMLIGYIMELEVHFTGSPPWDFSYSNGSDIETLTGITESPYVFEVSPQNTTTYTITSINNDFCDGAAGSELTMIVIVPNEVNDICDSAYPFQDLTIGEESCINGDNFSANGELPYTNQGQCNGIVSPIPSADLWYSFEAVSNILDVSMTFDMDTAVVSLYEGTCEGLIGRDCAIAIGGDLDVSFSPVAAGNTYYLQISGGSTSDVGNFTICIDNYGESIDEICTLGQSLVVDPTPVMGTYTPGQTVTFCFTMEGYNQNAADWIHGIVPEFGIGWDISTITNIQAPNACASDGTWSWYDEMITGTSTFNVGPQGPGFFIETASGGPGLDNNPGNNFGDAGSTGLNCALEFCFDITTTATCPPGVDGDDLSIIFRNFSDSETGSWSADSICPDDPEFQFKANLSCCAIPLMIGEFPTCDEPASGSITAIPTNDNPPYIFEWSTGLVETVATSTISDLTAGFYTVTVTDNDGCPSEASFTLFNEGVDIEINVPQEYNLCIGDSIQFEVSGGTQYIWAPSSTLSENDIPNPIAKPIEDTNYIVVVTDDNGCSSYEEIIVTMVNPPNLNVLGETIICSGESTTLTAIGAGNYSWSPATGLSNTDSDVVGASPTETTTYTVVGSNAAGCQVSREVTVVVAPDPFFPEINIDTLVCSGTTLELQLSDEFPLDDYTYEWVPTTGLQNPNMPNTIAIVDQSITYTLIVTNSHGCTLLQYANINVVDIEFDIDLGNDTIICDGGNLMLSVGEQQSYLWSDGSIDSTLTVNQSGTYGVTVTNPAGCSAIGDIEVNIENVNPDIIGNLSFLEGNSTNLGLTESYAGYEWSNGSTSASIDVDTPGTYAVTVTGENTCQGVDAVDVEMIQVRAIVAPSAFSPNNDGINDGFKAISSDPLSSYNMTVYNRWGKKVFETNDINQSWDGSVQGEKAQMGVYVYYFEAVFEDGESVFEKGNVTLIQ